MAHSGKRKEETLDERESRAMYGKGKWSKGGDDDDSRKGGDVGKGKKGDGDKYYGKHRQEVKQRW